MRSPGLLPSDGLGARVDVDCVSRSFGAHHALSDVSLSVGAGEIHAILGPNGAGKTTLLRIISGLTTPTTGTVRFFTGDDATIEGWEARRLVGFVPAGERSFYFRLSGRENLRFFARLHNLPGGVAASRAAAVLAEVGLADAAARRVGLYSNGMKQRLAVARALLTEPRVLLVDEATHNLDPDGARIVRELVRRAADQGAAVIWATQRLDEIRGFADGVTVLRDTRVRFAGSVDDLIAHGRSQRYVVSVRAHPGAAEVTTQALQSALGARAEILSLDGAHYLLALTDDASLGDAIGALGTACVDVVACREERSELEAAFLSLTRSPEAATAGAVP